MRYRRRRAQRLAGTTPSPARPRSAGLRPQQLGARQRRWRVSLRPRKCERRCGGRRASRTKASAFVTEPAGQHRAAAASRAWLPRTRARPQRNETTTAARAAVRHRTRSRHPQDRVRPPRRRGGPARSPPPAPREDRLCPRERSIPRLPGGPPHPYPPKRPRRLEHRTDGVAGIQIRVPWPPKAVLPLLAPRYGRQQHDHGVL